MLLAKQVDGIIVFPSGANNEIYKKLSKDNFPIVFIDRYIKDINVQTVLLNNENASYLAVERFIKNGYRNIAMITTTLDNNITPRIERINGYKNALRSYDLSIREEFIRSVDIEFVQEALKELSELEKPPEALLLGNDRVLLETLKYIKKNKIIIPDELAIIGIDNVAYADIFDPPITTISQPTYSIGKKAADLLLSKISTYSKNDVNTN